MDPESKKLLEETFSLTQENNKMLHKIRRIQKWSAFWQVFKMLLIIGVALGLSYFLEPYVNKILDTWSSISGIQQQNGTAIQDLLNKIKN